MKGKIGLEEHFGIPDTLRGTPPFVGETTWVGLRELEHTEPARLWIIRRSDVELDGIRWLRAVGRGRQLIRGARLRLGAPLLAGLVGSPRHAGVARAGGHARRVARRGPLGRRVRDPIVFQDVSVFNLILLFQLV